MLEKTDGNIIIIYFYIIMDISISNNKIYNNTKVVCNFTNGNKYGSISNQKNVNIFINENGLISNVTENIKKNLNIYYFVVKFENNNNNNINDLHAIVPKNAIIPLNLIKSKKYNYDKNINNILKVQNYLLCHKKIYLQNLNNKPLLKVGQKINFKNKTGTIINIPKRNSTIFKNLKLSNVDSFLFNAVNFTKKNFINNKKIFCLNPIYNNKVQENIVVDFEKKKYYYFVKIGVNIHLISETILLKYVKNKNNKTRKIKK